MLKPQGPVASCYPSRSLAWLWSCGFGPVALALLGSGTARTAPMTELVARAVSATPTPSAWTDLHAYILNRNVLACLTPTTHLRLVFFLSRREMVDLTLPTCWSSRVCFFFCIQHGRCT